MRNIRANIAFSLGLKGVFLVMAVMGIATLWMAVVADMGASLDSDRKRFAFAQRIAPC